MRAGGSNLQAPFFGSSHQFAACAPHVRRQFVHVVANLRADFNDGLVHLGLPLLAQARRSGGNKLSYVRTQLSRRRVNNLKLFFDTYSEPVIHERSSPVRNTGSSSLSYANFGRITSLGLVRMAGDGLILASSQSSWLSFPSHAPACDPGGTV